MVNLEHIRLLETKITRAIDYVNKVNDENSLLKGKLDSYQKRINELEVLVQQFKEDQGRIEDGILSALDRLNQFEDAIEQSLAQGKSADAVETAPVKAVKTPAPKPAHEAPSKNQASPEKTEKAPAKEEQAASEPALVNEEKSAASETGETENPLDNGELDIF